MSEYARALGERFCEAMSAYGYRLEGCLTWAGTYDLGWGILWGTAGAGLLFAFAVARLS